MSPTGQAPSCATVSVRVPVEPSPVGCHPGVTDSREAKSGRATTRVSSTEPPRRIVAVTWASGWPTASGMSKVGTEPPAGGWSKAQSRV
jgi:hypothetical protein